MGHSPDAEIEAVFHRHAAGVGSYFLARVGSAELAEELTSRVFVLVVQHFGQRTGSISGWLWSIAQSVLARHFRERGRRAPPPDLDRAPLAPDETAERRELAAKLPALMATLSEQQQEVVYLRFFQDLSHAEIAEATGLAANHVAVILHRALKRLREAMEPASETTPWTANRPSTIP